MLFSSGVGAAGLDGALAAEVGVAGSDADVPADDGAVGDDGAAELVGVVLTAGGGAAAPVLDAADAQALTPPTDAARAAMASVALIFMSFPSVVDLPLDLMTRDREAGCLRIP